MTDQINSQLSAFVDDALTDEESQLLVRRLCRDKALRQTLSRYALIGEIIRGDTDIRAPADFSRAVMMKVEGNDSKPAASPGPRRAPLNRPAVALAASVAIAAIVLVSYPRKVESPAGDPAPQVATTIADNQPVVSLAGNLPSEAQPAVNYIVPVSVPLSRQPAESRARLNNYLVRHLRTAGSGQGMATFRNVGYSTDFESRQ